MSNYFSQSGQKCNRHETTALLNMVLIVFHLKIILMDMHYFARRIVQEQLNVVVRFNFAYGLSGQTENFISRIPRTLLLQNRISCGYYSNFAMISIAAWHILTNTK